MSFVKDNGGPLTILVLVAAAIVGYIELRLPSEAELDALVDARFVAAGNVPPHRMARAEEKIEDVEEDVDTLTSRWNNLVDAISKE